MGRGTQIGKELEIGLREVLGRVPKGVDADVQRRCLGWTQKSGSSQSIDGLKTLRLNDLTQGGR